MTEASKTRDSSAASDGPEGQCPVEHGRRTSACPIDHKTSDVKSVSTSSLWKVLGIQSTPEPKECSSMNVPASTEEAAKYAQTPQVDQRLPLSTHRSVSSIPRGKPSSPQSSPHHQPSDQENNRWIYPSEQQVFNAMKRKGWQGVDEETIPFFLQIHNTVNERSWRELRRWESAEDIKLVRFQGRPNSLTPKAWFLSTFLFQDRPFDRHDWYIDNGVEHEKRYVLDFYMNEATVNGIPRVDIDVRPALDSPKAALARVQRVAADLFPGIATALQNWRVNQSPTKGRLPSQNLRLDPKNDEVKSKERS